MARARTTPPSGPADGVLPDQALVTTRIGSGSDHTVFINHVGMPVVEMAFDGPYGVYHSAYDSHHWLTTFGDPGFKYAHLMTQLWGTMALRLANAEVVPYDMEAYAASLRDFVRRLDDIPPLPARLDTAPLVAGVRGLRTAGRRLNHRLEQALAAGPPACSDGRQVNRRCCNSNAPGSTTRAFPGAPGSSTCSTRPAIPTPP